MHGPRRTRPSNDWVFIMGVKYASIDLKMGIRSIIEEVMFLGILVYVWFIGFMAIRSSLSAQRIC